MRDTKCVNIGLCKTTFRCHFGKFVFCVVHLKIGNTSDENRCIFTHTMFGGGSPLTWKPLKYTLSLHSSSAG